MARHISSIPDREVDCCVLTPYPSRSSLAVCLVLPAAEDLVSRSIKKVRALYASFLTISVIPIFVDAIINHSSSEDGHIGPREVWGAIFGFYHIRYVHPLVTALALPLCCIRGASSWRVRLARAPGL